MLKITDEMVARWMKLYILRVPNKLDTIEGWQCMAASNPTIAMTLRVAALTVIGSHDSMVLLQHLGETTRAAEAAVAEHPHYGKAFRTVGMEVPALRDLMMAELEA